MLNEETGFKAGAGGVPTKINAMPSHFFPKLEAKKFFEGKIIIHFRIDSGISSDSDICDK